jgi:hypothetical protein
MATASDQLSAIDSFKSYFVILNQRQLEPVMARIHPDCIHMVDGSVVGVGKAAMRAIYQQAFSEPISAPVTVQDGLIESNGRDVFTTIVLPSCTFKMNYAFDAEGLMTKHSILEVTKLE